MFEGEHIGKEVTFGFILVMFDTFAAKLPCFLSHSFIVLLNFPLYFVLHFKGLPLGWTAVWFVCELPHC